MTVTFCRDGEQYALRVDESTWEYLAPGTVVSGFERVESLPAPTGEYGEQIDPDDLPHAPKGHYVFNPKVCSVFMEEVFGSDMCEAWYNLVDAVLKGEDTFACKDQYTYDWMMGQFPSIACRSFGSSSTMHGIGSIPWSTARQALRISFRPRRRERGSTNSEK